MKQYHKIQTLFKRDPNNNHKTLLEGEYSKPEFEYLKDSLWEITEKVDGTNIRVVWDGFVTEFKGKTNNAQIPGFLIDKLIEMFPTAMLENIFNNTDVTLYGEGYGAKIQKGGGNYISDGQSFILFDVNINGFWLDREDVYDIAKKLSIKHVPVVAIGPVSVGTSLCDENSTLKHFISKLRDTPPEGVVMRPMIELTNKKGERIITKLKLKDFRR